MFRSCLSSYHTDEEGEFAAEPATTDAPTDAPADTTDAPAEPVADETGAN